MQQFQGQPHLAFWSGHYKEGVPRGMIYLLNDSYESVRNISTDPLPDLHEFQVADGGASALVAVKRYTQSALGTTMGTWVMDGCVRSKQMRSISLWRARHPVWLTKSNACEQFHEVGAQDFEHLTLPTPLTRRPRLHSSSMSTQTKRSSLGVQPTSVFDNFITKKEAPAR